MVHKCSYCKGKNRKLLADTNVVYQKWPLQVHRVSSCLALDRICFYLGMSPVLKNVTLVYSCLYVNTKKLALLETWPSFVDVMRYYTFP